MSVGRTRIADRLCEVIRVVAEMVRAKASWCGWSTRSKLPMRVDLVE
ncbi:hypothetical protein ACLB1Q_30620 [Escherichia coli]